MKGKQKHMASLSERSEQKRYEMKQKRIGRIKKIIVIACAIAVVAGVLFYVFFQMNRTYSGYATTESAKRVDSSAQYMAVMNLKILMPLPAEIMWQ